MFDQPLADSIQDKILKSLFAGSNASHRMKELLGEEPAMVIMMERLELKKVLLLKIQSMLNKFGA